MVEDQVLDRIFAALSDPTRRSMLVALRKGPARITDLAAPLPMSFAAVARHVGVLESAGLVRRDITGREHWLHVREDRLLAEIKAGEIRKGHVISLAEFGAFVDIGGADGLVHLSELSWKHVTHPNEVLKVGQEVEVVVLNVDHDRKRIGLSLKRREDDPWTLIQKKYQIGQLISGTITKLAKFGAFARVEGEDEIEGLIHVSELSDAHIEHPREVVTEGQTLTLRVIKIDADKRRMGLSLQRVSSAEYANTDWEQIAAAVPDLDDTSEQEA